MKQMRSVALAAALGLAAASMFAQSSGPQQTSPTQPESAAVVPPAQQATPDQIRKFFEVARLRQQMQMMTGTMDNMVTQTYQTEMTNIEKNLPPGQQLSSEERAALGKIVADAMHEATTIYPIDEMLSDAIPIYQRHISRTDADALIAFYSSLAGQHILDAQPAIMREYMPIVMTRMVNRSQHLTDQMIRDMDNAVKSSQTPPASPPSSPR